MRADGERVGRAVLIRTGALGDFVATLPVLERLRELAQELVVVAAPRYRVLFAGADRWVDAEGAEAARLLSGRLSLDADLGLAWTSTAAEALRGCGVRQVLAGTPRPDPGRSIHEHLWAPLEARFGPRDRDPRVEVDVEPMRERLARAGLVAPVVIAPGSGGASKRWPLACWREVAASVEAPVLWVGGPIEASEPGWGAPRWDDLDLGGLAALARLARAWLGPDAGPSHLAAASDAPVGVVFVGATSPVNWAPPGARVFDREIRPAAVAHWVRSLPHGDGVPPILPRRASPARRVRL